MSSRMRVNLKTLRDTPRGSLQCCLSPSFIVRTSHLSSRTQAPPNPAPSQTHSGHHLPRHPPNTSGKPHPPPLPHKDSNGQPWQKLTSSLAQASPQKPSSQAQPHLLSNTRTTHKRHQSSSNPPSELAPSLDMQLLCREQQTHTGTTTLTKAMQNAEPTPC